MICMSIKNDETAKKVVRKNEKFNVPDQKGNFRRRTDSFKLIHSMMLNLH
jgi:hypothetical protein